MTDDKAPPARIAELEREVEWLHSCNSTHMEQMRKKDEALVALQSRLQSAESRLQANGSADRAKGPKEAS